MFKTSILAVNTNLTSTSPSLKNTEYMIMQMFIIIIIISKLK